MKEKKFIIIRGISGSGKSFLAKQLVKDGQIFSTDDYFYLNPKKTYQFDSKKLGKAHIWNQKRVTAAVKANIPVIIVDNTNTTLKELKSYSPMIREALKKGYTIHLRSPETKWAWDVEECVKRNSHGVPEETIKRMNDKFNHTINISDILTEN